MPLHRKNKKPIVLIQSAIFDLQITPFRLAQFRDESLVKCRQMIIFFIYQHVFVNLCVFGAGFCGKPVSFKGFNRHGRHPHERFVVF